MPEPLNIYQAAARQRRRIAAKEAKAVQRILGAWAVAQKGVRKRLDAVTQRIKQAQAAGVEISPAWLYQQERWQTLEREIAYQVSKFTDKAHSVTVSQQRDAIKDAAGNAKELLEAAGVTGGFIQAPTAALENMVGMLTDKSPLYDLFKEVGSDAIDGARQVFAEGLVAGSHPTKIARALRSRMNMTPKRAVLIARTESLRAHRIAAQQNYAANSDVVAGVRISSSRDGRVCPLCIAQDGLILKHGQAFATHPGCRCALLPVVKYRDVDRGTGEEWLKAQPEAYQRQVLGKRRFELWSSGKVSMLDMVKYVTHPRWGEGIQLRPLLELEKIAGGGSSTAPVAKPKKSSKPKTGKPTTPVTESIAPKPLSPETAKPEADMASIIMHQRIGDQTGSNPGGLFIGADGVQRYVKQYADPAQAYNELIANEIYKRAGIAAPESVVFEYGGRTMYASTIVENMGTLGAVGLNKKSARLALDGFVGDVFLGNWDAAGMDLDNMVVSKDGKRLVRIDNGGSILFRARGGRKDPSVAVTVNEFDSLRDPSVNPQYARLWQESGYRMTDAAFVAKIVKQYEALEAVRQAAGSWRALIDEVAPGINASDRASLVVTLDGRWAKLGTKIWDIREAARFAKRLKGGKAPETEVMTWRELQAVDDKFERTPGERVSS